MMDDITQQPLDWEAVYWEYMPRIFNYFCYRVGERALAEDLTATTFVKAWKARREYNAAKGAVSTWLLTIARNTATDFFRRERENLPLDMVRLPIGGSERPVEEMFQLGQEFEQLSVLLSALSTRDRELVALKFGIGMTNRAIARVTGMTESNVGTTLHRLVKSLRTAWEVQTHD
jgi:RNA polymerase sigma-70 factor, ECF subfamily